MSWMGRGLHRSTEDSSWADPWKPSRTDLGRKEDSKLRFPRRGPDRGLEDVASAGLASNPRIPLVAGAVLPIAALAEADPGEAFDRFDPHHIFGVLVAELALDPEPERGAVAGFEGRIVHRPGEDGLRMESVDQVDALIIRNAAEIVGAVEDDVARLAPEPGAVKHQPQRQSGPLADRAPALDAIVAGDLGARGEPPDPVQGQ